MIAAVISMTGCATIPPKVVTFVAPGKTPFVGKLEYDGSYSGTLSLQNGPDDEAFTGRFVVVDKTATQTSQGTLVVPQPTVMPALGVANSSSSGNIDAQGFWFGTGNKGSLLNCILQMGRGGHGRGNCKHSNGLDYEILL
jgi:hypothetical protein